MNLFAGLSSILVLAAEDPTAHVANKHFLSKDIFGMHLWLWSSHVGNLVLAGVLTVLVLSYAASRIKTGPEGQGHDRYITRGTLAHMIEVMITYLRDNSIRPVLGARTEKFMPFLISLFFFILINNLLGLTPLTDLLHVTEHYTGLRVSGLIGATATQNIFVTGALALIAGLVINIAGMVELGVGGYLKHLTAGSPTYLWPLMVPIEILGTIMKPVALAIRLFANMTAGHILVAVLFMFAVSGLGMLTHGIGGAVLGGIVTVPSILGAIGIYFLELFVALLQAFVFMFLTTVFIGQLSHHGEHEPHEAHGHEHAHP
jgi:F-type H+-transporting ATPase subunit a